MKPLTVWVHAKGQRRESGWDVDTVDEAVQLVRRQWPYDFLHLIMYVTTADDINVIVCDARRFKRLAKNPR